MPIKDLYKMLAFIGGLLLIFAAGFVYLFSGIQNRNEKASLLLSEIQTELIREAKLKTLKETVVNTSDKRDELYKYVLRSEDTVHLIEQVEELGNILGADVSIQSVRVSPVENQQAFEWLTFTVVSLGSWDQALNLISIMESFPYRTEIESLVMKKNEEGGVSFWQTRIDIKVLKQK